MSAKNELTRTVQYWQLVDARDGAFVEEVDWDTELAALSSARKTFMIDGREHAGTVVTVNVLPAWEKGLRPLSSSTGTPVAPSQTRGVVLAASKDYVPNQENVSTGAQQPMGLAGDDWSPVDNLFVWHLPFGNMIAVLAESTSSSRAGKYADWLNDATAGRRKSDPDFRWAAVPVVDKARALKLKMAPGLKSFVYAGVLGTAVEDASGVRAIFLGPGKRKNPGAIRIEIKASVVRGKSVPHEDEAILLEWFNETFGKLSGDVKKAQVAIAASQDDPPTEVDLLHHRLTRKTRVPLVLGKTRAFAPVSAISAIVQAFIDDRSDLVRLRPEGSSEQSGQEDKD